VERLQRGGTAHTSVRWQFNAAFGTRSGLGVQRQSRCVLDAWNVTSLLFPHLLDAVVVQQWHIQAVLSVVAVKAGDELLQ